MTAPTPEQTLTEFLLARIAEDEEGGALGFWCGEWRCQPTDAEAGAARTRLRAECEAKRRIVEWSMGHGEGDTFTDEYGERWTIDRTPLKALALPYADHPDYRDEWRA